MKPTCFGSRQRNPLSPRCLSFEHLMILIDLPPQLHSAGFVSLPLFEVCRDLRPFSNAAICLATLVPAMAFTAERREGRVQSDANRHTEGSIHRPCTCTTDQIPGPARWKVFEGGALWSIVGYVPAVAPDRVALLGTTLTFPFPSGLCDVLGTLPKGVTTVLRAWVWTDLHLGCTGLPAE